MTHTGHWAADGWARCIHCTIYLRCPVLHLFVVLRDTYSSFSLRSLVMFDSQVADTNNNTKRPKVCTIPHICTYGSTYHRVHLNGASSQANY